MCSKHVSQKRNEAIDNCKWYQMLLKYTYSVISVIVNSLPGNTKKQGIDKFVAFGVRLVYSWAVGTNRLLDMYSVTGFLGQFVSNYLVLEGPTGFSVIHPSP